MYERFEVFTRLKDLKNLSEASCSVVCSYFNDRFPSFYDYRIFLSVIMLLNLDYVYFNVTFIFCYLSKSFY